MPPLLNLFPLFLILQCCLPLPDDLICMVMGYLAGPQEAAAMWSEPVNEVIMVLEGVNALLHQQCEVTDRQVVAVVSVA